LEKKYFIFRGIDYAASKRMREQLFPEHRTYVRQSGAVKMVHGGPLYDEAEQSIGSCLILEADSSADVAKWLSAEPFFNAGLFAITSVDRWGWTYGR
jgi:uncharacterized protein YciI